MNTIKNLFNHGNYQDQYKSNDLLALIITQSNYIHDLEGQITTLKDENGLLQDNNQRLVYENQELLRKINLNNKNSSIPSGLIIFKPTNKKTESQNNLINLSRLYDFLIKLFYE